MAEKSSLRGEVKMHPPQASGKRREIDSLEVKRVCNIKRLIRGEMDSNLRYEFPYSATLLYAATSASWEKCTGGSARMAAEPKNIRASEQI